MLRNGLFALTLWTGLTGGAAAHPHIFVDTGIEVIFDAAGAVTALRVTWSYDDLFSLIILEDRAMDPDFDGVLTTDELAAIQGFDMAWEPGFAGDTHALTGSAALALSGPSDWTTAYTGGRLTSTHLRRLAAPLVPGAEPLVVQVYDPGFYTAYTLAFDTIFIGAPAGCTAVSYEPDRAAADAQLEAAIAEVAGSSDVEGWFPAVGAAYAEEVRVTCAGRS